MTFNTILFNTIAWGIIIFCIYIFLLIFGYVFSPKKEDIDEDDMTDHFFLMEEFFDPRIEDHNYEQDQYNREDH